MLADSSDDSYVSAGEDPMEAPVFEFPLQDTIASAGDDVLLKCIITGTPIPEGTGTSTTSTNLIVNYTLKQDFLFVFNVPLLKCLGQKAIPKSQVLQIT